MKEKINIENYEAYLLDLAEGRLSKAEEADLVAFLSVHPELKREINNLPYLAPAKSSSPLSDSFKNQLLKEESTGLPLKDYLMIASVEGVMSKEEKQAFNELFEEEAELLKELSIYQKTVLPVEQQTFTNKQELKKREVRVIPIWTYATAIAAAILALFFLNLPLDATYEPRKTNFATIPTNNSLPTFDYEVEEELYQEEGLEKAEDPKKQTELRKRASKSNQLAQTRTENPENLESQKAVDSNKKEEIAPPAAEAAENEFANLVKQAEDAAAEKQVLYKEETKDKSTETAMASAEVTKVMSPLEYARKLIREDVLKNRSITESLMDEVANITNEKVKLEKNKQEEGSQQFALNIGKLRISKK